MTVQRRTWLRGAVASLAAAFLPASAVAASAQTRHEGEGVLTKEQRRFLEDNYGPALREIEAAQARHGSSSGPSAQAFPIAAVAIAAAAWCAKGALSSVPTSVIDDVANGGEGTPYVRNAIIGCIGGEIGGVVWKFLPGWVKKKAVEMVAAFIIKYVR